MKFINWIIKALKWLKELSDLVKWVIVVISLVSAFGGFRSCSKKNDVIKEKDNIIQSTSTNFQTALKNNAIEVNRWKLKTCELEEINGKISAKNSDILNDLNRAKQTIKELDIKLKNAEKYANLQINSVDTVYTALIFDCENLIIEPIKEKNIQIEFLKVNDSLRVNYNYMAEVRTLTYIQPKRKKNGKKHFPNWGFLWGWEHNSTAIIDDPNANITNYVEIEFKK